MKPITYDIETKEGSEMAKLKFGMIGCGGIANQKHLPALAQYPDELEITAFCDLVPERAAEAAAKYGTPDAKTYTDYRKLLEDKTIDVVHVLTPNVSHCEISVAALEAGKHVLCEKPMAATYADAKRMYDAHVRSGKLLTIGYQYRHWAEHQLMKRYCDEGLLGDIYYGEATALRRRGVPTHGVFLNKAAQGGGPLIDCGSHALDLVLWMMNNYEPVSVMGTTFQKLGPLLTPAEQGNGRGVWDNEHFEVEDSAFGFVRMKNGALVILRSAWAINRIELASPAQALLCGTRGGIDCKEDVRFNGVVCAQPVVTTSKPNRIGFQDKVNAGPKEARCWLDALQGKRELFVKPEQALTVTRILDAIYESQRTGKAVYFD